MATKPQLSDITGLSVVTINSLVKALIETGEIIPDTVVSSEGGRPAASFRYNSSYHMALLIYMHEQHRQDMAFYRVINLLGEVMDKAEVVLADVHIESFDSYIEEYLCKYPQIKAICFGIPGQEINQKLLISDYKGMREQSLSGYISKKYHLSVIVENDVNAAIMGYCYHNKVKQTECVIGGYFPDKYPPGAGICLNGKIYKGRNGLAGEIARLPLGIDWEVFDYNQKETEQYIIKVIQVFCCIYNPDKIVLYGDSVNPAIPSLVAENYNTAAEKIMLPDIILSNDLNADFEAGIKQIALNMIQTTRDFVDTDIQEYEKGGNQK
jgi:hypothetical protein